MISLINSEAMNIPLRDQSVHCVVTSPMYWGLRDYGLPPRIYGGLPTCDHMWGKMQPEHHPGQVPDGKWKPNPDLAKGQTAGAGQFCQRCGAWLGNLGLESAPELYVEHMVEVFREVKRVLRDDGTAWVVLGDSYAGSGQGWSKSEIQTGNVGSMPWLSEFGYDRPPGHISSKQPSGLKPKDLVGIPWRCALALQADGWWLRSDIIWSKSNPMPESVTDRPTKSHEYLFLLSKNKRYYYDAEAIKEVSVYPDDDRKSRANPKHHKRYPTKDVAGVRSGPATYPRRNKRTVWTIPTQSYRGAHFATYPEKLVEPCIKAGSSQRGVCPRCGAPWQRVAERTGHVNKREPAHVPNNSPTKTDSAGWAPVTMATDDWQSTCSCDAGDPVPATILDPFVGSGTTLVVARQLGRSGVGLDLSFDYLSQQAKKRLELDKLTEWQQGAPPFNPQIPRIVGQNLDDLPLFNMEEK